MNGVQYGISADDPVGGYQQFAQAVAVQSMYHNIRAQMGQRVHCPFYVLLHGDWPKLPCGVPVCQYSMLHYKQAVDRETLNGMAIEKIHGVQNIFFGFTGQPDDHMYNHGNLILPQQRDRLCKASVVISAVEMACSLFVGSLKPQFHPYRATLLVLRQ